MTCCPDPASGCSDSQEPFLGVPGEVPSTPAHCRQTPPGASAFPCRFVRLTVPRAPCRAWAVRQALVFVSFLCLSVDIRVPAGGRWSREPREPLLLGHLAHSPLLPGMMTGAEWLTLISLVVKFLVVSPSGSCVSSRMSCSL